MKKICILLVAVLLLTSCAKGSETHLHQENYGQTFKEKNIILNPQIEIAAHDLLIYFASIHLGISCVIEQFSKEELDKGTIKKLPLDPPLPKRSIGCAYLKNVPLSYAAKAFMDLIK